MRSSKVLLGACVVQGGLSTLNNNSAITSAPLSFGNSMVLSPTSPCTPNCSIHSPRAAGYAWTKVPSSAVVVATLVLDVNNATNVTRTSTIYNTDYEDPSPGNTNAAGTQITTFHLSDPVAHTNWSTIVAYPTPFFSYEYSWHIEGTYLTTLASSVTQCVTATTQSQITLPSHPAISYVCTANTPNADSYGEYYRLVSNFGADGNWSCHSSCPTNRDFVTCLFPNVSIPGYCSETSALGLVVQTLVHSLTATVTTYHSSSTPAQEGSSKPATLSSSFDKSGKQDSPSTGAIAALVLQDSSTASAPSVVQSTLNPTVPHLNLPTLPKSVASNSQVSTLSAPPLVLPVDSSIIKANSNSIPSPASSAVLPVITVGSQPITAISASEYVIGSQTVFPGSAITISSTVISLDTGALTLFIGSSVIPLTVPEPISGPLPISTLSPFTTNAASEFVFQTQTLTPGGPAITVTGTKLSLASNAEYIVENTHTINLKTALTDQAPPAISFAGSTYTVNAASEFIFQTQTLTPGGPAITVSSAELSLASDAGYIVEDTRTINLKPTLTGQASPFIVFAGSTFTANAASEFVFKTQTLMPGGPAITVSGAKLSLASNAEYIVEDTSTVKLASILAGSATTMSETGTSLGTSVGMKGTDVIAEASASNTGLGAQIARPFTGGAAVSRGICNPVEKTGRAACVVWLLIGALVLYVN